MSFYSIFRVICCIITVLATMVIAAIAGALRKCYKQVNLPKVVVGGGGAPSIVYTASLNSSTISETFFCAST